MVQRFLVYCIGEYQTTRLIPVLYLEIYLFCVSRYIDFLCILP